MPDFDPGSAKPSQGSGSQLASFRAGVTTVLFTLVALASFGCGILRRAPNRAPGPGNDRASFQLFDPRGKEDVVVILALSGGGSRAAYFSAAVMLQLEEVFKDEGIDILKEVDVISSVSGSSLPAAYYAISRDEPPSAAVEMTCDRDAVLPDGVRYNHERLAVDHALSPAELDLIRTACPSRCGGTEEEQAECQAQWEARIVRLDRISQGSVDAKRVWAAPRVLALMQKNYIRRWLQQWFYPWNIVRYWLTSYSRTDIMAGVFADDLFDTKYTGRDLTLGDLNPERPYLILNATSATRSADSNAVFGLFTFTREDFSARLQSDIGDVPVGRGVATSAAFPGVFNYMPVRDYRRPKKRYVHLFDGGNFDNLGLASAQRVIYENWARWTRHGPPPKIFVLLVDAFTAPSGIPGRVSDPRSFWDYFIDTNFLDSFDALLKANRHNMLEWFNQKELIWKYGQSPVCQITFDDIPDGVRDENRPKKTLKATVNRIPTDFRLAPDAARSLDQAAKLLVANSPCLKDLKELLRRPE